MPESDRRSSLPPDPRADLQHQVENITAALEAWRRTREYTPATEERLTQITVQCARMVDSWQQLEQHRRGGGPAAAGDPGGHLPVDPNIPERIRALERTIEHEWESLREGHDEPNDAGADTGSGLPAPNVTRALANTEARLAALEQEVQTRLTQLSRDLQSVLMELRNARPQPAVTGQAPAFPLESVMRIHEELRESGATAAPAGTLAPGSPRALPERSDQTTALVARVESLEKAARTAPVMPRSRAPRLQYAMAGLLVAGLAFIFFFGISMQRQVDTRLNEAAVRVSEVERQRDATVAATRTEAAREVADARQSALQAQTVSNVLAAPDRVRFWLGGVGRHGRASGQVLISGSRGLVFSASRLQPAPAGKTYQLWLRTRRGAPISVATFVPDSAGRVTLATETAPEVRSRLVGATVTIETAGATRPSSDKVLVRVD
jgi:hypothetical protein